jgi:Protein of unknown function (DUF2852)
MIGVIARIDDLGKPAWIVLMVLGFVVYWPIGLAILAYIIWSGRMGMWSGPMGCGRHSGRGDVEEWRQRAIERVNQAAEHWQRRRERREERRRHWGGPHHGGPGGSQYGGMSETGNRAFDEYRTDALRKLEEEASEFRAFLERLRMARDRAEFDEYIKERRNRPAAPGAEGPAEGPQAPPQT